MTSPYFEKDFFYSLVLLLYRAYLFITGQLSSEGLFEDDIAFFAMVLIGLSASITGVFLVVKRSTQMINSLSHTILLGIVVSAYILQALGKSPFSLEGFFIAALITTTVTIVFSKLLTQFFHVQAESAVGFSFTTLFALGILLSTVFFKNTHLGVEAVFGNIDALKYQDLIGLFWISVINLIWIIVAYHRLKAWVFDPFFCITQGFSGKLSNFCMLLVNALTIVGGFQSVGVVLIIALFCLPVLIAKMFSSNLKTIIVLSILISFIVSWVSVAISRDCLTYYNIFVSTGAIASILLFAIYCVAGLTIYPKAVKVEHS
jgi:manganese/zinc/iron transport system permease protein